MSADPGKGAPGPLWSMAAVSRETGITQHTLRAWERRFGIPEPVRLPSGHRRFTSEQVVFLRLVARLLDQGHRISDVIRLSSAQMEALLAGRPTVANSGNGWQTEIFRLTEDFDQEGIAGLFQREASRLGAREFLRRRLEPLLAEIGAAWSEGRLDIRHEHFLTEILQDSLRAMRAALEIGAAPPPLLLTTLPGEFHSLGLHMAALTAASLGRSVALLGVDTPVNEVVAAAERLSPMAVGISVSQSGATRETSQHLNRLRETLDPTIPLWAGGSGAGLLEDLDRRVKVLPALDDLEAQLGGPLAE